MNELPVEVITGNSQKMRSIVAKAAKPPRSKKKQTKKK